MSFHFADCFFEDASEGASPTSVDSGHGAFFRINKKDGDAVGGLDAQEKARSFGERGVAFARFFWCVGEGPDYGRVNLFERDEGELFCAEGGLEFLAIGEDVFSFVPVGEAKIEDLLAIKIGDASGSSAKPVNEPGEFVECFKLQNF
jgi:hypothetical protein